MRLFLTMAKLSKEQRRKNRLKGLAFERKVRADLENKGYIVSKWVNNVDLKKGKIVPAKSNFYRARTTGFPDFIVLSKERDGFALLEVKLNGILSKEEKEKINFYKNLNIPVWLSAQIDKDIGYKEV